tara:strand:+ start:11688 stop:12812 length:1125 start_codon:yes stop_codon:yes gene_type:complete
MSKFYQATRLNDGHPIIDKSTFTRVDPSFADHGSNINGPSVIRVPDWIPLEERADPSAVYYCYFGDHNGDYIRMAWSASIEGPYFLFGMPSQGGGGTRGVLDLGEDDKIVFANGLEIRGHISSPDVHVDHRKNRIVLYFHGPVYFNGTGGGGLAQKTFVAFSSDGLNFNRQIVPVALGLAYLRVFEYSGRTYGIAARGNLYTAPEGDLYSPPESFDCSKDYWTLEGESYTDTPFQHDLDGDPDGPERLRHVGLRVDGDRLEVFHSRVGDAPERILLTTIDLAAGPTTEWEPAYPPSEVLWPELEWEGTGYQLSPSTGGPQRGVQQLRDPYIFEDEDGALFLFYSGAGEEGIGVASLVASDSAAVGPTLSGAGAV